MQTAETEVPRAHKEIKLTPAEEVRFWAKVDKSGGTDACWIWKAGRSNGYGKIQIKGKMILAHRIAWVLAKGQIPHDGSYHGICVCHNCPGGERPDCVNPAHMFLGTAADNSADMVRKGRGNPPRGDANGTRTKPESRPRGDGHFSRRHPELLARGDANGARKYPDRLPHGESHSQSKLTESQVIVIRDRYAAGGILMRELAANFGVCIEIISRVINRKAWKHV